MHVGHVVKEDDGAVDLLTGRSLILSSTIGLALSATFQSNFPTFSSPAGKMRFCTEMVLTTSSADTLWACMAC